MIVHDRTVRFEDVDAAGIVYFARIISYCHDAMGHFFDALPGGYASLIVRRGIGFPAVHVTSDFKAPIRYGDTARITGHVTKIGTTSCAFHFALMRVSDGIAMATASHVHVCTNLTSMTKLAFPADVRAALHAHVVE